ncbi:MAG: hypothetical protein RMJ31_07625 [Nitrososphaerota archaeon]|nr:hypothetical protein [Nitrososphaerota archaeon]
MNKSLMLVATVAIIAIIAVGSAAFYVTTIRPAAIPVVERPALTPTPSPTPTPTPTPPPNPQPHTITHTNQGP